METAATSNRCLDAPTLLSDFSFELPPELIAQVPAVERDQARLLILDRTTGCVTHTSVSHLPEHLRPHDLLVVNDTRVVPARIFGRTASGGSAEILFVRPRAPNAFDHHSQSWLCLGKPARRLRPGTALRFAGGTNGTVSEVYGEGRYLVTFEPETDVMALLSRHGEIPLPPYIHRADGPLPLDQTRYQTIFASAPGAIAAPTAGLHFTEDLLTALRNRGVAIAQITLHVGPGTFLPVRAADAREHFMEPEWCRIPEETAAHIRRAKANGGRVVAIGTTTTRALESSATVDGTVVAGARWAERFIIPGQRFAVIDALFTNFHLPGSTLMLLVSAFAGRERIMTSYAEAVRRRYRFYSYGDAMLIQ